MVKKHKIPIICIDPSSLDSYHLFNPNEWSDNSKMIIYSCSAQYGLLQYILKEVKKLFKDVEKLCEPKFSTLQDQWKTKEWSLEKCDYFVEIPEVHVYIQAFLGTIKTFLDLIVQLISSEKIVSVQIDAFHRNKKVIGGTVINTLDHNSKDTKKEISAKIKKLIQTHKGIWIDRAVITRDNLTHPKKGMTQIMFRLKIKKDGKKLQLNEITKPKIEEKTFEVYAEEIIKNVETFSKEFLDLLKNV